MNFHVLTLFPEMILNGVGTSITGRAIRDNKISVEAINIRDFADNPHKKVDDYTYGGGAGMLMQAEPVFKAHQSVLKSASKEKIRTVYVTPQGQCFNQKMAKDLAAEEDLIILCGHYEGIDERVLEEVVDDYISIGDYVLTGGELASMVIIDAVSRLVDGVLNNETSATTESFYGNLLEYPQYSRPQVWHEKSVPDVLMSGNTKKINDWRIDQSIIRTKERRPDLYEIYKTLEDTKACLMKKKLAHIDMIETINRNKAKLVFSNEGKILLEDEESGNYYYTDLVSDETFNPKAYNIKANSRIICHINSPEISYEANEEYCLFSYTNRQRIQVNGLYSLDSTKAYEVVIKDYVAYILKDADTCTYSEAGKIEIDENGAILLPKITGDCKVEKLPKALLAYAVNEQISQGMIPYVKVSSSDDGEDIRQIFMGLGFNEGRGRIVTLNS